MSQEGAEVSDTSLSVLYQPDRAEPIVEYAPQIDKFGNNYQS